MLKQCMAPCECICSLVILLYVTLGDVINITLKTSPKAPALPCAQVSMRVVCQHSSSLFTFHLSIEITSSQNRKLSVREEVCYYICNGSIMNCLEYLFALNVKFLLCMFSMIYEKIVEWFHKTKITYNLCRHLWFVSPVSP